MIGLFGEKKRTFFFLFHSFRVNFHMISSLWLASCLVMLNLFNVRGLLNVGRVARNSFSLRMSSGAYQASGKVTSIAFDALQSTDYKGDLLLLPFYESPEKTDDLKISFLKDSIPSQLSDPIKAMLLSFFEEGSFKGEVASKQILRLGGSSSSEGVKYVAVLGLGVNPKKEDSNDLEISSALRIGKNLGNTCKDLHIQSAGVVLPLNTNNAGVTQLILGFHESLYQDNRYKKVPEGGFKPVKVSKVTLLSCSSNVASSISLTSSLTSMISEGVSFAKDLVNAPPNSKTPLVIADLAKKMASEHNMKCVVLGEEECKARNMGAYLGVQQGSMFPPQFIHLTYRPEGASADIPKIALVGKGLTFDSGGYNLKAGAGSMIELMKFDMGGCAAVLGAAKAIGQLRPKNVEVHFITAVCENMVSGS